MTSPKKDLINENLYEIPTCTICLQDLTEEVTALACGHCFHYSCIDQHFGFRGTCPNCQKRASPKEMRFIHFSVVLNSKANDHLRTLLSSLNISERKQVEELLIEIKKESMKVDKLKNQMQENEKEVQKKSEQVNRLTDELDTKTK